MAEICRKIRGQGQSDQSVKLFQALSRSRRRITWPPAVVCAVRRDEPPDWGVHIQSELISRRRRRELGGVRSVIDCRVDLFDCVGPASRKQLLNTFERKANSGGGSSWVLDTETEQLCWLIPVFRLSHCLGLSTVCFHLSHTLYYLVETLGHCRRLKQLLVLPLIVDTSLSPLMMWNLRSYATAVLNERMWHIRGSKRNYSDPPTF